jgi:hypothetical protein
MNTKATILAAAVLALASASSFAQGTISFLNTTTTLVTTNSGQSTGNATSAMGIKIQLFYQPDTGGSAPTAFSTLGAAGNWESLGSAGLTVGSPLAGRFGPSTLTTGTDVAAQGNVWLMAVAWNGGEATYGAITVPATSYAGYSAVWSQATGGGANGPVSTTGFAGLQLLPVPEPSTIALAGLGAASLLLFRRRK